MQDWVENQGYQPVPNLLLHTIRVLLIRHTTIFEEKNSLNFTTGDPVF